MYLRVGGGGVQESIKQTNKVKVVAGSGAGTKRKADETQSSAGGGGGHEGKQVGAANGCPPAPAPVTSVASPAKKPHL